MSVQVLQMHTPMIFKRKYTSCLSHNGTKYAAFKEYQLKDTRECANLLLTFLDNKSQCGKFRTNAVASPTVHNMV